MTEQELQEILRLHKEWLADPSKGRSANLVGANLCKANLSYVNLVGANLRKANLTDANLVGANLTGADTTNIILDEKG